MNKRIQKKHAKVMQKLLTNFDFFNDPLDHSNKYERNVMERTLHLVKRDKWCRKFTENQKREKMVNSLL